MISAQAASEIATRYYNDIYKVCLHELQDEDRAGDVTQEVFLTFQQKLNELTETEHIRAWLYKVADNKLHEHYRYVRTERAHRQDVGNIVGIEDPAVLYDFDDYCYVSDEEILSVKEKILQKLSPEERQLFDAIYEKRRKYRDIAEEIGVSERAVNLRALRLRQKIRQAVEIAFVVFVFVLVKMKL